MYPHATLVTLLELYLNLSSLLQGNTNFRNNIQYQVKLKCIRNVITEKTKDSVDFRVITFIVNL
jgi:hypothetical protein